jgi:dTDP-4-amino-4,6-dideoxygalactose transaminase
MNPYKIVSDFEEAIADYAGSKYAVAAESCTAAIFLSLMYRKEKMKEIGEVRIPKLTYPSIPCSIIHAGGKATFIDIQWNGVYELMPLDIWDAALRFKRGMYHGGFQCLSFHIKKLLPIGRGGAILTDDKEAYEWFKLARFDGREPVPLQEQKDFTVLGYNFYMPPTDAARGLQLLQALGDRELPDLKVEDQKYCDLSKHKIYTK